jgi:ATP-dependent DNA helicase RecG
MRPPLLDPLFAPVTVLPRIGPKLAPLFARLAGRPEGQDARLLDLILMPPYRVLDRGGITTLEWVQAGVEATVTVLIDRHQLGRDGGRVPHRIHASDDTGEITLTFFQSKRAILERQYPVGETVTVFGRIDFFNGRVTMVHPEKVSMRAEDGVLRLIEPLYPRVAGLTQRVVLGAVDAAMKALPDLPEWLDAATLARDGLPAFGMALAALHDPADAKALDAGTPARKRLALDEFLAAQIALAVTRRRLHHLPGTAKPPTGAMEQRLRAALPYQLTGAQQRSISEISADLASGARMLRLLQGDVGSGKTIVALFAMVQAAEAGYQSLLMAPTELLARQHFAGLSALAAAAGLRLGLLTGRMKSAERADVLAKLANGALNAAIGTHALFQDPVEPARLGLIIVDEQHRFGVHQRLALSAKGAAPDVLVMTATPIPRTLVLAAFGDMESSRLDEKPAGRKPVLTTAIPVDRIGELAGRLAAALDAGAKAYWICPRIDDDAEDDEALVSVQARFTWAQDHLPGKAGIIHGRMDAAAKDAAMAAFRDGRTPLLIATTVIEVGVDVPDATIIVIEHAERFGLAQLHQLRGRVGRGDKPSTCILLYSGNLGAAARARLDIMRQTEDGFRIAEEDLALRGEGELLGTRQSGDASFRLADLAAHKDLLQVARDDARRILDADPELATPRGRALVLLLHLFGRDDAARLLRAG